MTILKFDSINSTNTYLKENYSSLDNLTIVRANHQTSGKGRLGRTWQDDDDLLFSILIKEGLDNPTDYSLLIASTLVNSLIDFNPMVKWPNDIMINDKKVSGILLEAITKERIECVIIGVGINVNTNCFSSDLLNKAISLKQVINKKIDKELLFNKIIERFTEDYSDYINHISNYIDTIKEHFYLQYKIVSFNYQGKPHTGKVIGLENNGKIIIETSKEKLYISTGEITLEDIYKK